MKGWNDDRKGKRKMAREEEGRNAGQAEQANLISFCPWEGKAQAMGYFFVGSLNIGKRQTRL